MALTDIQKIFAGPCDFILGITDLVQLPEGDKAEVAFAGRSNVGKSSLLNALAGRKTLARTSNTPGRTQQLNFFDLGGLIYLVDMPGYGYAKVSKKQRSDWDKLIFNYLRGRPNLRCVFILVDCRHGLKPSDDMLMEMLDEAAVPYRIILTKADKGARLEEIVDKIKTVLKKHPAAWPEVLVTSSQEKIGMDDLQSVIIGMQ